MLGTNLNQYPLAESGHAILNLVNSVPWLVDWAWGYVNFPIITNHRNLYYVL